MSLNPSVATSVVPSESVSNAAIDYTARELSISKRRQRLKNPTDIWYHFEKGRKRMLSFVITATLNYQFKNKVEPTLIGDTFNKKSKHA